MSGPSDAPQHNEVLPSVQPDPFAGARSEIWSPPQHRLQQSHSELSDLLKPTALAGEGLMAGGIIGRVLLASPLGQRLSLGIAAAGLLVSALSLTDVNKR